MNRVQCVSLPRSGHNLLVTHLQKYFQPAASICKKVRNSLLSFREKSVTSIAVEPGAFHYCEYYYACRCHPCTCPGNTFQKSHDFELQLPVDPAQKYLIQRRSTLDLLISWFELRLPKKRENDSPDGFNDFLERMQPYVDGFHQKWIHSKLPNRIVFDYEAYLNSPAKHLRQAIQFFNAELQLDTDRIERIVADVRPPKDNRKFRYIDFVPERLCA